MSEETILIIEDDAVIRALLQKALSRPPAYRVLVAADGLEGRLMALQERPDAMLLDLALPHLNGLDLMAELIQAGAAIPTIVITAEDHPEQILRAFRLGAKDYLQKPFSIEQMRAALENAMAEERLRRERDRLTKALTAANIRQNQQLENWSAVDFIAKTIVSTLEEEDVLRRVVATVNHLLGVEAGSLLLIDQETNTKLRFAMTLHGAETQMSDIVLDMGQGIAGWVALHGESLLVPDVQADPRFYPVVDQITGFESKAILCVPLKVRNRTLGVLEVINKRSGPESPSFTEEDRQMLMTLASWVAIAVENARLTRSMQDAAASRALRQLVVAMAHHINNHLMNYSLELDSLEHCPLSEGDRASSMAAISRRCIGEISEIVTALGKVTASRTVPYVGSEEMLDIDDLLHRIEVIP
jgi:DNA-binding response OmpR family regulator